MRSRIEIIIVLSIIITVFTFLYLSRTLVSGYHFADDHEIIRINHDLKSSSVFNESNKWITEDIESTRRFRPLYFFHRVIETKIFGSNFFVWSVYTGLLACVTLVSFYLAMRNMKFRIGESLIFLIIVFTGTQMSVWWRLGPQETIGITFFALSFYFMSRCLSGEKNIINNSLFVLFLILTSLCKESFIISIPGIIFFKICNEKISSNVTLRNVLLNNIFLLVPIIVMILELIYISLKVGTISAYDTGLHGILNGVYYNVIILVKTYPFLGLFGLSLIITNLILKNRIFEFKLLPVIFALLILIPNLVLYAQPGMYERYLLPSSIGFGLVVASILNGIEKDFQKLKAIIYLAVIISITPLIIKSYNYARSFTDEGSSIKSLISGIKHNYKEGTNILIVVDPVDFYEQSYSLKTYLLLEENIKLYGYPILKRSDDESSNSLILGWKEYFKDTQFENLNSVPDLIVFLDNGIIKDFFNKTKIYPKDYSSVLGVSSSFTLLKRNTYL